MGTGTKVVIFLDPVEIATLDSICAMALCSRQEAFRYLLAERKRAQDKFKAERAARAPKTKGPPPRFVAGVKDKPADEME